MRTDHSTPQEQDSEAQASQNCAQHDSSDDAALPNGATPPEKTQHEAPSSLKKRCLRGFDHFAAHVTKWTGSPLVFALACALVVIWAVTGPIFGYSETWQLVINTGTTIITFLMVFLIQQSQNKDSEAVHIKLNELLKSHKNARDTMIDIEHLDEEDLAKLAEQFTKVLGQKK